MQFSPPIHLCVFALKLLELLKWDLVLVELR